MLYNISARNDNAQTMSRRRFDVIKTFLLRHVPAGMALGFDAHIWVAAYKHGQTVHENVFALSIFFWLCDCAADDLAK